MVNLIARIPTAGRYRPSRVNLLVVAWCVAAWGPGPADGSAKQAAPIEAPSPGELLAKSKRMIFLGDSITASGQYVSYFEAWLAARREPAPPHVIDVGLPSETVSGLSEEGHAGGKFPRPVLAERLDRVLAATKPDLVVACYGINCGIYEPFDTDRFQRYQQGMSRLKSAVEKAGARFIAVTPPVYDDRQAPKPFSYNEVLDRYSDWLLEQRARGWSVIDLHGPMNRALQKRRAADPQFTFQPDGVHPNDAGHWFVAQELIRAFGDERAASAAGPEEMLAALGAPASILPLARERVDLLRNSYVSAAGHKRPGVKAGLPIAEAEMRAQDLTQRIDKLLTQGK